MGIRPSGTGRPGARGKTAEKVVVSVGPYALVTVVSGQASRTRRTMGGEAASPPVITSRREASSGRCASASTLKRVAVRKVPVTFRSAIRRASSATSRSPGGATTTTPPFSSGTHNS